MSRTLLFVYGTLKRGGSNVYHMGGSLYLGRARLEAGTTLYTNGFFPMMVECSKDSPHTGVLGELYEVDEDVLAHLDRFEGHPTHFRRQEVSFEMIEPAVQPQSDEVEIALTSKKAQAYYYRGRVAGRRLIGAEFLV